MRPRQRAAEKQETQNAVERDAARFNEAAAKSRGKTLRAEIRKTGGKGASMRPRQRAAEKRTHHFTVRPERSCFNEAAAKSRGKTAATRSSAPRFRGRFNEAAAKSRGKTGVSG